MPEVKEMGRDMSNMYKWRKENQKRYEFYLHRELDKNAMEWLEKQPNKREYLIRLINADREKNEGAQ